MKFAMIAGLASLASLAFLAGMPAQAQTAVSDPVAAPDALKPAKEKHVCRSEEVTGSVVTKRVCHTKAEWSLIEKEKSTVDTEALQRENQVQRATARR